jgi:hypothetical protein
LNGADLTWAFRPGSTATAVGREAIAQMDRWLTKLSEDTSKDSQIVKVRRAKPADLMDACWTRGDSPQKIAEKQTRDFPDGVCDWSKPGVGQQKLAGTWLKFERSSTN